MSPLHIPTKEHDIVMDKKNRREGIECEISVSIGTQDTTYDCWSAYLEGTIGFPITIEIPWTVEGHTNRETS